jgi:hypothetical protein
MGGHVLRETTSRGLCELGCPSRTSERGREGDCVKEGRGGEGQHIFAYRRWFYAAQQHASGGQGPGDARGTHSVARGCLTQTCRG